MSEVYVSRVDSNSTDELQHYGVKGMKWGVRRDVELVANRKRNAAVRKAKNSYETGEITKAQYKSAKKQAKSDKKDYMKNVKKDFEGKTKAEQYKMSQNITKQAINNVPNRRLKKGIKAVNTALTVANIGEGVLTAAAFVTAGPAVAAAAGIGLVAGSIGELGRQYVVNRVVDRLS